MKTLLSIATVAALTSTAQANGFPIGLTCSSEFSGVVITAPDAPPLTLRNAAGLQPIIVGSELTVPMPVVVVTGNNRQVPLPPLADVRVDCMSGAVHAEFEMDALPMLGTLGEQDVRTDAIDAFGSVGLDLDLPDVRVAMGWAPGRDIPDALGPKDPDAWYLYFDAELDDMDVSYDAFQLELGGSLQFSWWLDPSDPAIYAGVRGSVMGDATGGFISGVGVGFSNEGNLHWTPTVELRGANGPLSPDQAALTGHVAVESKVSIQPTPHFPIKLTLDGDWMFDLGENFSVSNALGVVGSFLAGNGRDGEVDLRSELGIQPRFGANVRGLSIDIEVLSINLGKASVLVDGDSVHFSADPEELGLASLIASAVTAGTEGRERARRLLELMVVNDVQSLYGYVERDEMQTRWGVGFIADIGFGICSVQGAHVAITEDGIEVTHDDVDCNFDEWAQDALAAICTGVEDELEACVDALEADACDFACEADGCYDDCRAEGNGNAACKIRCGFVTAGCEVAEGFESVCEAGLAACAAIDDFCAGIVDETPDDGQLPEAGGEGGGDSGGDGGSDEQTCELNIPNGYVVHNLGTVGCGRWTTINAGHRASGNLHTPGQRPTAGSLLVKASQNATSLTNGVISVDIRGTDNDVAGIVFGFQSLNEYNLAILDDQENAVQLWRRSGGTFSRLRNEPMPINLVAGHHLQVKRSGKGVRIYVDGTQVLQGTERHHRWGRYGLFSYANDLMNFRNLSFEAGCGTNMWAGWTMENLGQNGCGWWGKSGNVFSAGGNLHTAGERPKRGSLLVQDTGAAVGGRIAATVQADDNDVAGLVIDYRNLDNYIFAVLDDERNTVSLWRRANGSFEQLFEVNLAVNLQSGQHHFELRRVDRMVRVFVDGTLRINFDLRAHVGFANWAAYLVPGRRGLYSYAMDYVEFHNVAMD